MKFFSALFLLCCNIEITQPMIFFQSSKKIPSTSVNLKWKCENRRERDLNFFNFPPILIDFSLLCLHTHFSPTPHRPLISILNEFSMCSCSLTYINLHKYGDWKQSYWACVAACLLACLNDEMMTSSCLIDWRMRKSVRKKRVAS